MNRPQRQHIRGRRITIRTAGQPGETLTAPQSESGDRNAPRRKTILVVEDSASFGGLLVALLREEGYRALRAWDGREALRMARDRRPELVLLDLSLPYRDGLEVLHELKSQAETADAPILVVSGNTLMLTPEDRLLLVDVVTKPFDVERLLNVIRRAVGDPEQELPDKPSYNYGHEHAY